MTCLSPLPPAENALQETKHRHRADMHGIPAMLRPVNLQQVRPYRSEASRQLQCRLAGVAREHVVLHM